MPYEFEITAEEIANGVKGDGNSCPIALAIKKKYPGSSPAVDEDEIHFEDENGMPHSCTSPNIASRFVIDFDAGRPVKPFKLTIEN